MLIERFAITGGDLTVGGVANFCGETKGQGEVFDALLADLDKFAALAPYSGPYPKQGRPRRRSARLIDRAPGIAAPAAG